MKEIEWKLICKIDGKIADIDKEIDASALEEIGNALCDGLHRGTVRMCDPEIVLEVSADVLRMVTDAGDTVFDGKDLRIEDMKDWKKCPVSPTQFIMGIPLLEGDIG